MAAIDRRTFLALSGTAGLAATLGLAGCSSSTSATARPGTVTWWDEFQPLQALEQKTFDAYTRAHAGTTIDYTVYDPSSLGSALQLAQQSGQLPDVFTNGFGVPDLALVDNGWVQPIELSAEARARFGDTLVEGLHLFDGKLYSFPLFTARQHATLSWFDRRTVERAGGDPDEGPRTWDEYRAVARRITRQGDAHGWIEGLTLTDRMRQHVVDLATGAGADLCFTESSADTPGVADARTGEYPYDGEAFVQAFEFLGAMVRDGVMFPSSTSLDVRTARARWAGGAAALFLDGPWNAGVLNAQFPDFLARTGVGAMPTPDGMARAVNGPPGGSFWLARTSSDPQAVNDILTTMTTDAYATGMAGAMDQPPRDVDAVADADVPELYKRAVRLMQDSVRIAPSPIARNPAVGAVLSEMNQVRPTLGEITQGYLGGNVDDVKAELTSYTSRLSTERDRAIAVVRQRGRDVSVDDWRFTTDEIRKSNDA